MHLCDIFLEEIHEAMKAGMSPDIWLELLRPYLALLGKSDDRAVFARLYSRVFEALAGKKWLLACMAVNKEEDATEIGFLRHVNPRFRHTRVEPLPAPVISAHFKDQKFAAAVALKVSCPEQMSSSARLMTTCNREQWVTSRVMR
jgi:hypothetical protein